MSKSSRSAWVRSGMAGAFLGSIVAGSSLVSAQYVQPVPGAGSQNQQQPQRKFPPGNRAISPAELQNIINDLDHSIQVLGSEQSTGNGDRGRTLNKLKKARDAVLREFNEVQHRPTNEGLQQHQQADNQAAKSVGNEGYPGLQQVMRTIQRDQQVLEAQQNDKNDRRQHALNFLTTATDDLQRAMSAYAKAHPEVLQAAATPAPAPAPANRSAAPAENPARNTGGTVPPTAGLNAQQAAALIPGTGQPMRSSDGTLPTQLQRILDHIDNSLDTTSRQPNDKAGHKQQAVRLLEQARQQVLEEMQELGVKPQG